MKKILLSIAFILLTIAALFIIGCVIATTGDALGLWDTPTWVNAISVFIGGGSPIVGIIAAKN